MYRLEKNRSEASERVCQTFANPILIMDYLELREALLGIALIFYFGIIFTQPGLLTICLIGLWGIWPSVRTQFERGIVVQKIYRLLGMKFPGVISAPSTGRLAA